MIKYLRAMMMVFLLFLTSPVFANEKTVQITTERTENCLKFSTNANDCIGSAAGFCSELPWASGYENMMKCVDLERGYWQEKTATVLDILLQNAAIADAELSNHPNFESGVTGLMQMHKGFERFRDSSCFKQTAFFAKSRGPSVEQSEIDVVTSNCLMHMDGDQAIYLQWVLDQGQ